MTQPVQRLRTTSGDSYVARRPVPLPHLQITATTSGAAQTLVTVPENRVLLVSRLAVVNTTGGAVTLTLHSVPSGGTLGAGNTELAGYSIAANTAVDLSDLIGGMYEGGATLQAYSNTSGALVLHGHGEILA